MVSEKLFQKRCVIKLRKIPKSWWHMHEVVSTRGLPDVWGCINGVLVWLEFKKSEKEAQKTSGRIVLQKFNIEMMLNIGAFASLVYPENWEEVFEELQALGDTSLLEIEFT